MSSKKAQPLKKEESQDEVVSSNKKEHKALMNFFLAGKNWTEGEVVDLPEKDIEFLLSEKIIS